VLLGALVGSRFVGTSLGFLARILVPSFGAFLVATIIATAFGLAVAVVIDIPFDQAIVAFAPGGLDAMMSLALALHMDTAFVAAHQFARFAGIAFGLPFFLRWARRRGRGRVTGVTSRGEPLASLSVIAATVCSHTNFRRTTMRGILLWLIGIPIPIIILLYLFGVF
jgi:hypothetical protein